MIFVYSLGVSVRYLSAGLSGSIKRMTGGADRVSVAKTPPCSWIPKPVSGSPLRMISLVSTWKTCPPGPTELDARDTAGEKERGETQREIFVEKWQMNGAGEGLRETKNAGGKGEEMCTHRDVTGVEREWLTYHRLHQLCLHQWPVKSVHTSRVVLYYLCSNILKHEYSQITMHLFV